MSATPPLLIICMGVSGCGKSTLGSHVAAQLRAVFVDADDFHDAENRAQMSAGVGLTDEQRAGWMDVVCAELLERSRSGSPCVLAHSALHKINRERLRQCGFRTLFLHMDIDVSVVTERVSKRRGHFVSAAFVPSQFASLESTSEEDDVVVLDGHSDLDSLRHQALTQIRRIQSRVV